jgi:protein-disulfide isomerase
MATRQPSVKETTEIPFQAPTSNPPSLLVPALILALTALAFCLGALWQRVEYLQKGGLAVAQPATNVVPGQPTPAAAVTLDQVKNAFGQAVIKFGDTSRKLTIIEIADPSCPYCHAAAGKDPELNAQIGDKFKLTSQGGTYLAPVPELKKLVDQGKASFAYVYFPGHGNGEMGTKALMCAYEMGRFWEAHDLIMSNAGYNLMNSQVKNDKTKSGQVASFLAKAVDQTKLKSCLDSGKYDSALTTETSLARSLNTQGTPGFFLNEKTFPGAYDYSEMKSTVDNILQ